MNRTVQLRLNWRKKIVLFKFSIMFLVSEAFFVLPHRFISVLGLFKF